MGCSKIGKVTSPESVPHNLNQNEIQKSAPVLQKNDKIIKPIQSTITKIQQIEKPIDVNDPLYKLFVTFQEFKKSIEKNKENFSNSFELFQKILKNIVNDFNNQKFKVIKKKNKVFSGLIGKYQEGIRIMNMIGFRDQGEEFIFSDSLLKSFVQMKVVELNIIYSKLFI